MGFIATACVGGKIPKVPFYKHNKSFRWDNESMLGCNYEGSEERNSHTYMNVQMCKCILFSIRIIVPG